VNRFTFVVQVHPEGISSVQNLSTEERVPISELAELGPLIERWLAELAEARPRVEPQATGTA
jgi:hypothetical protein